MEGRKEEHLATALFNDYGHSTQGFDVTGNGAIRILDYQLPLKATRDDEYWKLYLKSKAAGAWKSELHRLAGGVEDKLNISVSFLSLSIPDEPVEYEDGRPKFIQPPLVERAW